MKLVRFISLFYKIKPLFNFLPKGIQEDLVDDFEEYYELCLIAKSQKMKGEK